MWRGPEQDPGGVGGTGPPQIPQSSQELTDLKDQFEQQQLLIAQLKEMLRKNEQTTVTQEKVEAYANTLTKMNARAKRSIVKKEGSDVGFSGTKRMETPASEKINLLRQQLEENKLKLAERGKSQKGIEEIVTQLKAQLDDSQTLISQTPLNLSLAETKSESYSIDSNSQELYNILINKEKRIADMCAKIQKLEANVLDLQENVKEKDSVIDARTKAITLMSENLSKKGKSTLDALDDTKLQMRKMQENFVELELEMKQEKQDLMRELEQKNIEIYNLKDANNIVEKARQELLCANSILQEQVESQNVLIEKYQADSGNEASIEISRLTQQIKELEEQTTTRKSPEKSTRRNRKNSKQRKSPSSDDTDAKTKIIELEKIIDDSRIENRELSEKIDDLTKTCNDKDTQNNEYVNKIRELEDTIKELCEKIPHEPNMKQLDLDIKLENEEVVKLKKQLEEGNKNMIKVKAQQKAKIKELNKKIDAFKKVSDANAEIVKLQDIISKLNHKMAELEEEKGALQLKIVETDSPKDSTSVEQNSELERKQMELAAVLSAKEEVIVSLEKQIEESKHQVEALTEKVNTLSHLENVQVKSEITSIHFEEQLDKLELEKQCLIKQKDEMDQEKEMLQEKMETLVKEKQEISAKLDSYVQENIDLMDKLEKLSAEKVSSAESIEIVEGLTQQEKLELEAYQKNINIETGVKTSTEHLEENPELNESVNQLTEETSELLQKIELFTVERREVMEKMENLTQENNNLSLKIKEIENNRDVLAETYEQLQNEKEHLDGHLEELEKKTVDLQLKLGELGQENEKLKREIDDNVTDQQKIKMEETFKNEIISDLQSSAQISNENLLKEIEEYKALIEIQKQEINELKVKLMDKDSDRNEKFHLGEKMASLQTQYELLLSENELLKQEIKRNSENVHEKDDIEQELNNAKREIKEFEEKITNNLEDIDNYKAILEENKNELISSANLINDLQSKIKEKEDELSHFKNEVTHLTSNITDLNIAISSLEQENEKKALDNGSFELQLQELKQILNDNMGQVQEYEHELQTNTGTINHLQKEIKLLNNRLLETENALESKTEELQILQKEKEQKDSIIVNLQDEIRCKDEDFHKMFNDLKQKCLILQNQIETNTGSIDDIKNPLEAKIHELEQKNSDQLGKMKKIAANLKKKTAAYLELEQKYSEINEKWEIEQKEKETFKIEANKNSVLETKVQSLIGQLTDVENELSRVQNNFAKQTEEYDVLSREFTKLEQEKVRSLIEQLTELENELANVQNKLDEKTQKYNILSVEFSNFKQEYTPNTEFTLLEQKNSELLQKVAQDNIQIEDLQNILREYESKFNSLTSENEVLRSTANNSSNITISEKDEVIKSLSEQLENVRYSSETNANALQVKIQELEMFIETQESELTKSKERVNKLEEGLSNVEERRMSLERKAIELGAQLEEKSTSYEEISQTEDLLEQRLSTLIARDEVIEKRLQETISENQELVRHNKALIVENDDLKCKITCCNDKINEMAVLNENVSIFVAENVQLKQFVANLEAEKKELKKQYDGKLKNNREDIEKSELELQNQLELINDERKTLVEKCEKLSDQLKEYIDQQDLLNNEMSEYKQKLDEKQNELRSLSLEYQEIKQMNTTNLVIIEDLNSKINNDNLPTTKEEFDNLKKLLQRKDSEIEEYQRQNLQLQMQAAYSHQPNAFAVFDIPVENNTLQRTAAQSQVFTQATDSMSQIETLQKQVCDLELQKQQVDYKLSETEKLLQDSKNELDIIKSERLSEQLKNTTFESENDCEENLQLQLTEAKNKLDMSLKTCSDLKRDNDNLELNNVQLTNKNTELLDRVLHLENEVKNVNVSRDDETKENVAYGGQIQQIENVATFTWPEATSDPFEFIVDPTLQQVHRESVLSSPQNSEGITENTKEELLKKIKTLEFMLYNVEKEKDEALVQCNDLSNELARLVYDREQDRQLPKSEPQEKEDAVEMQIVRNQLSLADQKPHIDKKSEENIPKNLNLESQIVSEEDTYLTVEECNQLRNIEFAVTKPIKKSDDSDSQKQPIAEDTLHATTAYLCYDPEIQPRTPGTSIKPCKNQQPIQNTSQHFNVESQIVSEYDAYLTPDDCRQLRNIEFEMTKPIKKCDESDSHREPVIEDTLHSKTAYVCYNPEQNLSTGVTLDTFGENDDGWGWSPEEAKLEQEHQANIETSVGNIQFMAQINELEQKIQVLEQAREKHLEEIKQSQLKSGKLIKKLKEFKSKNEQLSSQLHKKGGGFDDLNDAIQDEFKSQIQNLEKRIKENNLELEKERQEKTNLLKRVDVLTAANDRMVENKEKQDVEILSWQRRTRELSAKLEQFEWGDGGFESPKHKKESTKEVDETNADVKALKLQIDELTDTIKDLTLDNEELQTLLEEQRNLRISAEKAKLVEPILANMKTEAEYSSLLRENDELNSKLILIGDEKTNIQEKLYHYEESMDTINLKLKAISDEKSSLSETVLRNVQEIDQLNNKVLILQNENTTLLQNQHVLNDNTNIIHELKEQVQIMKKEIDESNINCKNLENNIAVLNMEKAELFNELAAKNTKIEALTSEFSDLSTKLNDLQKQSITETLNKEKADLTNELSEKSARIEVLSNEISVLLNDIQKQSSLSQSLLQETDCLKEALEEKSKQLFALEEQLVKQKDEFVSKEQQLAMEWAQKVDERGNNIADSWKMHVESLENDYKEVLETLKKELNELDQKYNGLVNENNELRKNVDAEIRNEVDHITALQQQINDKQNQINEFTRQIHDNHLQIDLQSKEIANLNSQILELNDQIRERDINFNGIQSQIAEKQNIINDLVKKLESTALDNKKVSDIEEEIGIHKSKLNILQQQLLEKELIISENSIQIDNYMQEIETYKLANVSLQNDIKENTLHIEEISRKLKGFEKQKEIDDTNISMLQQQFAVNNTQLQQCYMQIDNMNQEVTNYNEINDLVLMKEAEIYRLNLLVQEKDREINHILESKSQESISAFTEQSQELDTLKRRFAESENHYEELLTTKDIDVQGLRLQLQEQVNISESLLKEKEEFLRVQTELSIKSAECEELQNKLHEQSILLEEENKQLSELREIIQEQVIKIEDLQKEVYIKSKDYDALVAEIDIPENSNKDMQDKHVKFADGPEIKNIPSQFDDDNLSEPVNRAELDLALYMLHQRDVRCEELTVELMQLLEERDTLQLRLSNALREKEQLRSRCELTTDGDYDDDDIEAHQKESTKASAMPKSKASAIILGATGTELATEAAEHMKQDSSDALSSKLSELRTVGYRKDKTLLDEQELRRLQQYSIMQQHREEAAKLPPEAAARLVDANYTLSRDVQSPSKVLLNWLWGRSTPKVNNI